MPKESDKGLYISYTNIFVVGEAKPSSVLFLRPSLFPRRRDSCQSLPFKTCKTTIWCYAYEFIRSLIDRYCYHTCYGHSKPDPRFLGYFTHNDVSVETSHLPALPPYLSLSLLATPTHDPSVTSSKKTTLLKLDQLQWKEQTKKKIRTTTLLILRETATSELLPPGKRSWSTGSHASVKHILDTR